MQNKPCSGENRRACRKTGASNGKPETSAQVQNAPNETRRERKTETSKATEYSRSKANQCKGPKKPNQG
eukprot:12573985-Alexandrium_andersonii.AAC.1